MGGETEAAPPTPGDSTPFWSRVRENKVIQWAVAYLGAALALAHGAELVTHALHWPDGVWRGVVLTLIVGFPIAVTLAWYHGHKGLTKMSQGELAIVSVLMLIGAVFFTAALRPDVERELTAEGSSGTTLPRAGATPTAPPNAPSNTVVVLPFANNSSDSEQEHFAVGLADQLRDSLSRIRDLRVTGRTSSMYFKDKNESLQTIGEQLGVEWVVEGSLQRAGDDLRITAELNNTRTGYRQWGDTYPGTLSDVFDIQDEITKSVADALQVTLGVGDLGRRPGMTRDVAAYEEALTAMGIAYDYEPGSFDSAIEHLKRAIALDSSFAAAWFMLSFVYSNRALAEPDGAVDWARLARDAGERAVALSPPDSFIVLAWEAEQSMVRGDWSQAGRFYVEELPDLAAEWGGYSAALTDAGIFLVRVGRIGDAIGYLERARAADPLSGIIALYLGYAYGATGAHSPAFAEFERSLDLGQIELIIHGNALLVALGSGDQEEIERRVAALPDAGVLVTMGRFLDDPTGAADELRRLAQESGSQPVAGDFLAHWAAYYDQPEMALALLRQQPSPSFRAQAIWRAVFSDVRKLEGFKDLVREMGLVDYWRKYGWSDFCRPIGDDDFECE